MADFPIYFHVRYDAEPNKNGKLEITCTDVSDHDFVEVVRCKDCKKFQTNHHWCGFFKTDIDPDEFCSYGERRDPL